jgi:pimeloyl-ACP methyl ester carboxylesterase
LSLVRLPSGSALHLDGPIGAPSILILHGVGGAAWSWQPQREALAPRYRLGVWEARGHGDASAVADAGLADYYTDAREALDGLVNDAGAPVFVAGHSMGGLLAIALAADRGEHVAGLLLVDPVYSDGSGEAYGHMSPALGGVARRLCEPLLRSFERGGSFSRMISRWMFEQAFEDRARMEAAWTHQRLQVPVEYPRMLRESFVAPIGFELRDFVRDIDAPALLIECRRPGGRARFPAFAAAMQQKLGERFTQASVPGGHYLQLDRPEEVNALFATFLERYASGYASKEARV